MRHNGVDAIQVEKKAAHLTHISHDGFSLKEGNQTWGKMTKYLEQAIPDESSIKAGIEETPSFHFLVEYDPNIASDLSSQVRFISKL